MELTEKYRPKKLDRVVGQEDAVRVMSAMLDRGSVAKCWLFTGPSGCGKTTLARILKRKLKVDDIDYREIAAESTWSGRSPPGRSWSRWSVRTGCT